MFKKGSCLSIIIATVYTYFIYRLIWGIRKGSRGKSPSLLGGFPFGKLPGKAFARASAIDDLATI